MEKLTKKITVKLDENVFEMLRLLARDKHGISNGNLSQVIRWLICAEAKEQGIMEEIEVRIYGEEEIDRLKLFYGD